MRIRKLELQEHKRTRALYEEIFPEDGKAFTEYYYEVKGAENTIYAAEEEGVAAMLHLNPYQVHLGGALAESGYIVAVATKENYRHQGLMRKLIYASLGDKYVEKVPFVFLMPAAEAIYLPFDFRFIYAQNRAEIQTEKLGICGKLEVRQAQKEDLHALNGLAEALLPAEWRATAVHTEQYFAGLLQEQACQQGEVAIVLEQGDPVGYFFWTKSEVVEIRELVGKTEYQEAVLRSVSGYFHEEHRIRIAGFSDTLLPFLKEADMIEKKPVIMARIVHLEQLLTYLKSGSPIELRVRITDEILQENDGCWLMKFDGRGGVLEPLEEGIGIEAACSIGAFTSLAFGYQRPDELGAAVDFQEKWECIQTLAPVFFNEIV